MPKRIFIKDGGLTSSVPTPTGYTVIGANGGIPKKQIISTISDLAGSGSTFQYEIGQYVSSEGGVIYHRFLTGTTQNYLVVDTQDLTQDVWSNIDNASSGAISLWDGQNNSSLILSQGSTNGAAYECNKPRNGHNDWYLPAVQELNKLWNNMLEVSQGIETAGGNQLALAYYWSSTEVDNVNAWNFSFTNGAGFSYSKDITLYVRAVRKFTI